MQLTGKVHIVCCDLPQAVALAAADLANDLHHVLGVPGQLSSEGAIRIALDPALGDAEAWRIDVQEDRIAITGSDTLGAVFGIYQFAERMLGVDPLWYWKDVLPEPREVIELAPQIITSTPATFRFRGWFVNDEDLLTEWRTDTGDRFIRYPFYAKVVHPQIIDRVCEALLRTGGNMIIPASFCDIMNPPEATLVEQCVKRGLYVTQHHIEALGVSHFGFENYWQARGEDRTFEYFTEPDKVRECWHAHAARWWEIAGEQVIWQLGLRGKGDRPAWHHIEGITEENAGDFINQAMRDQLDIIRQIDTRPTPPATTTLWLEGAKLMAQGALSIPDEVAVIFADHGPTETMQADFDQTPRDPHTNYGAYYHVAFWSRGPHLTQGTRPAKLKREFDRMAAKGDTHYAIVNVANVREHVLGIEAAMACMNDLENYDPDRHINHFAGKLAPLYRDLLDAFVDVTSDGYLKDGCLWEMIRYGSKMVIKGDTFSPFEKYCREAYGMDDPSSLPAKLDESAEQFDAIVQAFDHADIPQREQGFRMANLKVQAIILRGFSRATAAVMRAFDDRSVLDQAIAELEHILQLRTTAEYGKWEHWYRGDRKEDVAGVLQLIIQSQESSV